jgi:hypothetical protein
VLILFALTVLEAAILGVHLMAGRSASVLEPQQRRILGLVLGPSLLSIVILRLIATSPDDAAGASLQAGSAGALAVLLCLAALVAADLVALIGGASLERSAWWLIAAFGLLAAIATAWAVESLARGASPGGPGIWIASGARVLLMAAAGEAVLGLRPRAVLAAGLLGVPLLWFGLPALVAAQARAAGALPAALAAAVLLTAAGVIPARLRRIAAVAGVLVACLAVAAADDAWRSGRLLLEQQPQVEVSP